MLFRSEGFTYGEAWTYPVSYTFEFDVKVTGTEVFEDSYDSALYDWFGGTNQVSYECGYYFNEGKFKVQQTVGKDDPKVVLAEVNKDFSLNEWHKWRFQYDNASCTMRFYFDGELMFSLFNKYFDYSVINDSVMMILRRMNVQCMIDNVRVTNFVNYSPETNIPGDVDNNGTVNSTDIAIIKRAAVGKIRLTPEQFAAADVNGDERINARDILMIKRYIIGLISSLDDTSIKPY